MLNCNGNAWRTLQSSSIHRLGGDGGHHRAVDTGRQWPSTILSAATRVARLDRYYRVLGLERHPRSRIGGHDSVILPSRSPSDSDEAMSSAVGFPAKKASGWPSRATCTDPSIETREISTVTAAEGATRRFESLRFGSE